MAAAYLFHIVKNHAFLDGNKRTALVAALVFLDINGVSLERDDE
jgi:death-on-curing protein